MPDGPIDPATLQGDALTSWYLRSPDEIERERQSEAAQRYQHFFGGTGSADPDPGFDLQPGTSGQNVDPGFSRELPTSYRDVDPGFTWIPVGPNRWRSAGASPADLPSNTASDSAGSFSALSADFGLTSSGSAAPTTGVNRPDATAGDRQTAAPSAQRPRPPQLDPARTDVFQPGPDGKLHPIPGWHTTGPFEFPAWSHNINWGGVGKDLGNIASGVADFTGAGALAEAVVKHLGYDVGGAVIRGIVQGHHPWPRFMGGPAEQELARLHRSLHTKFHSQLGAALKEAGFPRVGGIGGATEDWAAHFKLNPESFDKAVDVLRDTTRQFDKKSGTWISKYLDRALPEAKPPAPNPGS